MGEMSSAGEPGDARAPDFEAAAQRVLAHLHERVPMSTWYLTRLRDEKLVVLAIADRHYGLAAGDVFEWSETFCSRMVAGDGPRMAPDLAAIPAYAGSPLRDRFQIGAYAGVPLRGRGGDLFGTLCAIDPETKEEGLADHEGEVELLGDLLSSILAAELRADDEVRRAERAEAEALLDSLTGVGNRRMWDRLVEAEEARCKRYGNSASVILVDVDGLKEINDELGHAAGDDALRRTAEIVKAGVRGEDAVARLGGDEFGVLAIGASQDEARELVARLRARLAEQRIAASVGQAARQPNSDLTGAWAAADEAMYREKRARQGLAGDGD